MQLGITEVRPRWSWLVCLAVLAAFALAGCGPNTEYHYGRYEAAYERYSGHWVAYQIQLAAAERKAVDTGEVQWKTAQLITRFADAQNQDSSRLQLDDSLAGQIRAIKHATQQIAFNFDIPEKSGELPSEGLLGLIAVEGMTALDLASVGALALIRVDPTGGIVSTVVTISVQIAKLALEEILKEVQHRSEIAQRVDELVAGLDQESQSLIDKTAQLFRIADELDQDRVQAERAHQQLREVEWDMQNNPDYSPQSLSDALEQAVATLSQKPLQERVSQPAP